MDSEYFQLQTAIERNKFTVGLTINCQEIRIVIVIIGDYIKMLDKLQSILICLTASLQNTLENGILFSNLMNYLFIISLNSQSLWFTS